MSGPNGIYPVLYAFFDERGGLDRAAMRRQVEGLIGAGVHGIAVLGLGTEVNKLDLGERRTVLDWAAEDVAGRSPLAVTAAEPSVEGQVAFVKAAAEAGASWAILQPPPVRNLPEDEYVRFFAAVAERAPLPLAIQNAPEYIGIGLSNAALKALHSAQPGIGIVKAETSALGVAHLIEETEGALRVFNGRGGLELTDNLRNGCAGVIPGAECADVQARIYDLIRDGGAPQAAEADQLYRSLLPLLVFLMQSLDTFLCYGKRLAAKRLGITNVYDRAPGLQATPLGLANLDRHAAALGPLEADQITVSPSFG